MILKGFREKSNKKYFNKVLTNRKVSSITKPIESLGVILNIDEANNFAELESVQKLLNIKPYSFKIITYSTVEQEGEAMAYPCFSPKDIGWAGKINHPELELFLNTKFDALISYYFTDILDLKVLTATANADFKIGVLQEEEQRLNDLIINVNPGDLKVFKRELLKYLSILKRI